MSVSGGERVDGYERMGLGLKSLEGVVQKGIGLHATGERMVMGCKSLRRESWQLRIELVGFWPSPCLDMALGQEELHAGNSAKPP